MTRIAVDMDEVSTESVGKWIRIIWSASRSWLMLALVGCAATPPAPFSRTPDEQIVSFPRAIIEPQPTRPEGVGAGQVAALVMLRVGIDRTGTVRTVRVSKSAGPVHDQEATDAMMRARFQPALDRHGQPVDCEITWKIEFSGH
jgi:TonB family protein